MLSWANRFNICVLLDNHHYTSRHNNTVECLVAAGAVKIFEPKDDPLTPEASGLREFNNNTPDWIFGHLGYDCKNYIEPLSSKHFDGIGFPDIFFFQPEIVLQLSGDTLTIASLTISPAEIYDQIQKESISVGNDPKLVIKPRITKQEYISAIESLKKHIQRGDCYEINFCQEFFADNAEIDAISVYNQLTKISPVPFACFYKLNDKYLLCASPERYLKRTGGRILSQPVKGTFKRNHKDAAKDELMKQELHNSAKERSENVMIVDLVRNDLSKVCVEGSVHVEELFGIYTFPQVHQMVSTVAGTLKEGVDLVEILKATFPMGSMTGAPKRKVMELIEQYEQTKRGLYSGSVGYIDPNKNFDFNVVIRSILYSASQKYLSYQVGGGITFNSEPEKEYEECLLKAEAIRRVLQPLDESK